MDIHYTEHETSSVAGTLLDLVKPDDMGATVVGLTGDLGAGKTTLSQSIARHLGVTDTVVSPTFVIAKMYITSDSRFEQLIHIDAYRIEDIQELDPLGWEGMVHSPKTLILVEWPERITEALPPHTMHFHIDHAQNQRHLYKV